MLKFIGTGSAFNTKLGNNSAYIKEGNQLFLIDCGSANFHRMKESGLLDDIEHIHVYITHTHPDHVGSLGDLIFYMYYSKGELKQRVTVYSVYDNDVDNILLRSGVGLETHNHIYLSIEKTYEITEMSLLIAPIISTHVENLDCYGLLIEDKKKNELSIYTGDTSEINYLVNKAFEIECLHYLYVDTCSQDYEGNVHLSLKKLTEEISLEYRNKVWCMHIDEKFDIEYAKSLGFNVAEVEM